MLFAAKVELADVFAGVDLAVADFEDVTSVRDQLQQGFVGIHHARLVHITELDRLAECECPAIGLDLAGDHFKEGGLARSVGTDHTDNATGREIEAEVFIQYLVAVGFGNASGDDDLVAQLGAGEDDDLVGSILPAVFLRGQLFIVLDAGFALGLAGFGAAADPFQFVGQGFLPAAFTLGLLSEAYLLLFQPTGIVSLIGDAFPAVQFQYPAGHVIEEIAVVSHGDHGALILLEVALQPEHGFGVQMVGGLVQQQDVRLL